MLRLCPLVPFSVLNFCVGFTSLTWFNFVISLIGIIPSTVIYVYIGTGISDITDAFDGKKDLYDNTIVLSTAIIGSLLGLIGIIWTSCVANKYLNEAIKNAQSEKTDSRRSDEESNENTEEEK
jgi:hypothetical protein